MEKYKIKRPLYSGPEQKSRPDILTQLGQRGIQLLLHRLVADALGQYDLRDKDLLG